MTLSELCASLRRGPHYIRHLQQELGLPVISSREGYPPAYAAFLGRIVFLRVFGIPLDDIASLIKIEKKLMEMLRGEPAEPSPLWFMADAEAAGASRKRLLLTRFDLGPWIQPDGSIQCPLDIGRRPNELFGSAEMGEDIRHVFTLYREQASAIAKRLREERGLIRDALAWVTTDVLRKA